MPDQSRVVLSRAKDVSRDGVFNIKTRVIQHHAIILLEGIEGAISNHMVR
jgi:hypothetical protein